MIECARFLQVSAACQIDKSVHKTTSHCGRVSSTISSLGDISTSSCISHLWCRSSGRLIDTYVLIFTRDVSISRLTHIKYENVQKRTKCYSEVQCFQSGLCGCRRCINLKCFGFFQGSLIQMFVKRQMICYTPFGHCYTDHCIFIVNILLVVTENERMRKMLCDLESMYSYNRKHTIYRFPFSEAN